MRRYLFRCDASADMGLGHLARCLALAAELKDGGAFVAFAGRLSGLGRMEELKAIADELLLFDWELSPESDAREVIRICGQDRIDAVVIDHYRADEGYQMALVEAGVKWLQIDGFAKQPMWADWVLNTSPIADEGAYLPLKKRDRTRFLLGPKYALLRREFLDWRPRVDVERTAKKILFTFGGGDDRGCAVFCLEATKAIDPGIERVVLVSDFNPRGRDIKDWTSKNKDIHVKLLENESKIAKTMALSDIAITTGGTTTFETAAMGLPSLIVEIADNQHNNAVAWESRGAAVNLGRLEDLKPEYLKERLQALIDDRKSRASMARAGMETVDCLGAGRLARILADNR